VKRENGKMVLGNKRLLFWLLCIDVAFASILWVPKVSADEGTVRQAIVQNARKAAEEGWHYLWGAEGELPQDGGEVLLFPGIEPDTYVAYDSESKELCRYWLLGGQEAEVRHTDCSGLVYWAYTNWNGYGVPTGISVARRTAYEYYTRVKNARRVSCDLSKAKLGDLLFNQDASHVGIVVDPLNHEVVHASWGEAKVVKPYNVPSLWKCVGDLVSTLLYGPADVERDITGRWSGSYRAWAGLITESGTVYFEITQDEATFAGNIEWSSTAASLPIEVGKFMGKGSVSGTVDPTSHKLNIEVEGGIQGSGSFTTDSIDVQKWTLGGMVQGQADLKRVYVATLEDMRGSVEVVLGGMLGKTEWQPAFQGLRLDKWDRVRTCPYSKAWILPNGGAQMEVGQMSTVSIVDTYAGEELPEERPTGYELSGGALHYVSAEAIELIKKILIKTPGGEVSSTGTEFTLEVLDNSTVNYDEVVVGVNSTRLMVFQGKVEFKDLTTNATVPVQSNQMLTVPQAEMGHNETELNELITAFDPNTIEKWWIRPKPTGWIALIGFLLDYPVHIVVFFAAIVVVAVVLAKRKGKPKASQQVKPPAPSHPKYYFFSQRRTVATMSEY